MHLPIRKCPILYIICFIFTMGFISLIHKTNIEPRVQIVIPVISTDENINSSIDLSKCHSRFIPNRRNLGNLFRRDETINYLGFVLRSHSLFYCSVPKVATRTLLLFVTYLHIRDDLIPLLSKNPKANVLNIQSILSMFKNDSQATKLDSVSLLSLFLSQLQNLNSSKIDLWSIYQRKTFPSIRLRSLPDPSIIFSSKYLRAIFVRHPLERLASAYTDKITSLKNEPFTLYDDIRRAICRTFSSFYLPEEQQDLYKTNKELRKQIDEPCQKVIPTFEHFLEFFMRHDIKADVHWKPYSKLCNVCLFKYNFIGKFETIQDDFQRIVEYVGLNVNEWIKDDYFQTGKDKDYYKLMYSNLKDKYLCYLKQFYENDFKLFDYQLEDYLEYNRTIQCSTKYYFPRF